MAALCPRHPARRRPAWWRRVLRVVAPLSAGLAWACGGEVPRYDGPAFGRDPAQVGPLQGRILTSNAGDDTLSVVDVAPSADPARVGRLPVGFSPVELEGPHHLSADPGGRFVYINLSLAVAGSGGGPHGTHGSGTLPGWALKLDAQDGRELGRTEVEQNPGDNTLSADGKTLFVTHYDLVRWTKGVKEGDIRKGDSTLVAIDTETMRVAWRVPLCPAAHGVRLSGDGTHVYATCGTDAIAFVDVRRPMETVQRVQLPGTTEGAACQRCPYALSVAPDDTVWVSSVGLNGRGGGIDVFDPRTKAFDARRAIRLRGSALFAAFAGGADAYRAFVPEQGSAGDMIHVYTAPGGDGPPAETATITLERKDCLNAHMLLVDAAGARGHLVCEGDQRGPGSFVWLDLARGAVDASVPVGVFPDGLVLVPGLPR